MSERSRLCFGVMLAMVEPSAAALFYFVLLSGSRFAVMVFAAAKVFLLIWPALAAKLLEKQNFYPSKTDWSKHAKSIPLGAVSGLLMALVILAGFQFTDLGGIVYQNSDVIRSKAKDMKIINHFLMFSLLICLGHSLLEEYYWRWYVYGRLRKLVRPPVAYFGASLAFAGHHYIILGAFFSTGLTAALGTCVALGGGLWCWLFQRHNSIIGCWISHMMADGAIFYVGYQVIYS